MTPAELALFAATLADRQAYLEFGCGGSTLAALRSGLRRLTSVDSDIAWIRRLREHADVQIAERTGRLAFHHADLGAIAEWGLPKDDRNIRNWFRYYSDVWKRDAVDYDVILIDGRFRVACALTASLLAPAGSVIMIHDYTLRPAYSVIEKYYEITATVDTLIVARKREQPDMKALTLDLLAAALDVS